MSDQNYEQRSLKLLGVTARLQTLMINQRITPLELVNCANAARAMYLMATSNKKYELTGLFYCDFCNRDSSEKGMLLVAGLRNTHICSECVDICRETLDKKRPGGE